MPTLLSLNNYHYRRGGAEVVHLEHMQILESVGWRSVPFAMHHPRNLPSEWSRFFVDEIEFDRHYSPMQKAAMAPRIVYSFQTRRRLSALLDTVPVDVAHVHNIYHHISPSALPLLRSRAIPVFLTLHDLKLACPAYRMLTHDGVCERCRGGAIHNVVLHRCIKGSLPLSALVMLEAATHKLLGTYQRCVTRFFVPSRFLLEKFVEWGWPRDRFSYVPNFVSSENFEPSSNPGDRFAYVGRLSPEKGVATLLMACARAKVPLTIVGSGPDELPLKALAAELRVDVQFSGHQGARGVAEILRRSRALIIPSEWYENAPISILEAYASAKVVIGSRIGGIPELVRDGETGALFATGSVDELADRLTQYAAMSNAALTEMGNLARNWVDREFSPTRYRERVLREYEANGVRVHGSRGPIADLSVTSP